ncbi:hypothetical protein [Bacillus sp. FSL M7-0417]|uniref:hypothetical protein n=1 Tax=Bacillus sp. FSL M7-0417 TaxID=2921532 RepID=UPI0027A7BA28|nr:hypothetical protein [Bacillus subtilis]WGD77766.1 hypothetical protein P5643_14235 [Bacillus subtilis]
MIIDTRDSGVVKIEGNGDLILTKNKAAFELRTDKSATTAIRFTEHVIYGIGDTATFRQKLRISFKVLKYIFRK